MFFYPVGLRKRPSEGEFREPGASVSFPLPARPELTSESVVMTDLELKDLLKLLMGKL